MKRITKRLYSFAITLTSLTPLSAQNGLHVAGAFGGAFQKQKDATEVLLRGNKVSAYNLSLYRSLMLNATSSNVIHIERMVKADGKGAIDKEISTYGGHISYALYQLKPENDQRRYIFYRNEAATSRKVSAPKITLIYMEGKATIDALKRSFSK